MQAFLRFRGFRKWLPGGDVSLNGVAERQNSLFDTFS
jgi:hypothetical protein